MKIKIRDNFGTREYDFGNNRSAMKAAELYGWATANEVVQVTTNKGKIIDQVTWFFAEGYKKTYFK